MSSNTIISLRPEIVIRQIPWRLGSKAALGFILILAIFSLVGWLYLTDASSVTATSYRIDELRLELDQIRNQNATLIMEVSKLQALSRVEARARELGFRPASEIEYVHVENYPLPSEVSTEPENVHAEHSVDAYRSELEEPAWWVEKLDVVAAWLDGRSFEIDPSVE